MYNGRLSTSFLLMIPNLFVGAETRLKDISSASSRVSDVTDAASDAASESATSKIMLNERSLLKATDCRMWHGLIFDA